MLYRFSVIVPTRNSADTLDVCLKSILIQSVRDFELIVVDNNSTDKTKALIQNLAVSDQRIRYVFEPKIGRGAARNTGVKIATGDIILMTDSDCVVPIDWIEKLTQPILTENENIVMGFEEPTGDDFWSRQTQRADEEFWSEHSNGDYADFLDTKNVAFRREVFLSVSFDSQLRALEDFDFYLKIRKQFKIRVLRGVKVAHNHARSFLGTLKVNFVRACWSVLIYDHHRQIGPEVAPVVRYVPGWKLFLAPVDLWRRLKGRWIGEIFFRLVAAFGWTAGLLVGKVRFLF